MVRHLDQDLCTELLSIKKMGEKFQRNFKENTREFSKAESKLKWPNWKEHSAEWITNTYT